MKLTDLETVRKIAVERDKVLTEATRVLNAAILVIEAEAHEVRVSKYDVEAAPSRYALYVTVWTALRAYYQNRLQILETVLKGHGVEFDPGCLPETPDNRTSNVEPPVPVAGGQQKGTHE